MKKGLSLLVVLTLLLTSFVIPVCASPAEDVFVDELSNWNIVYEKSAGWQLDPTDPILGTVINKMGNDDEQYITYMTQGLSRVSIYGYDLVGFSDYARDIKAYVSNENSANINDWTEIDLTVSGPFVMDPSHEDVRWRSMKMSAEIEGAPRFLRVVMGVFGDANNCWVLNIDKVEIGIAPTAAPPGEGIQVDELQNWSIVHEKSAGWQLDGTDPVLGTVINKMSNDDEQYITYMTRGLTRVSISGYELLGFSDYARDIKAYVSDDNDIWTELSLTINGPFVMDSPHADARWRKMKLFAEIEGAPRFLKVVMGSFGDPNNCWVLNIDKVEMGLVPTNTITDELGNWSNVYEKSNGWQFDATIPQFNTVINKAGNNDVQYITYKVNGVQGFRITGYQWNVMSDFAADIKAYVSDDNGINDAWQEVNLAATAPVHTGIENFSEVTLSAAYIEGAPTYLKIEMQELDINDVINCWVTSIERVEIDTVNVAAKDTITDPLTDWTMIYRSTDGWQLDNSAPSLDTWINKAGNNDTQSIIYYVNGVESIQIDTFFLASAPELSNFVKAYFSEDAENWTEIPLSKGIIEDTATNGWQKCSLFAANIGATEASYVKMELQPLVYDSGLNPITNCYGIGFDQIGVNNPVAVTPGEMESEEFAIDYKHSFVSKITEGTTADTLTAGITNVEAVLFDGEDEVNPTDLIKTGMTLKYIIDNETVHSLTVVVSGDIDGNGMIDSLDLVALKKDMLGLLETPLAGAFKEAANVSEAGSLVDLVVIKRHMTGNLLTPR